MISTRSDMAHPARLTAGRGRLWPTLIVGLILANMSLCGVTVYFATSDRSFAVEPGYDRKARDWDAMARQRDRSAQLGWTAEWTLPDGAGGLTTVRLRDPNGTFVSDASVRVVVFHHADAGHTRELTFMPAELGCYGATVKFDRPGIWELRVTADRNGERFLDTQTLRVPDALARRVVP